jgi:enoyl-CoA hydratase/carnithine racemase
MEMALTGDPLSAERAYQLGLINELCAPGQAVATAKVLADRISANAPLAVRASLEVVRRGMLASDIEAWRMTDLATESVMSTEDFAEGPRAFIEKRPPVWTGR